AVARGRAAAPRPAQPLGRGSGPPLPPHAGGAVAVRPGPPRAARRKRGGIHLRSPLMATEPTNRPVTMARTPRPLTEPTPPNEPPRHTARAPPAPHRTDPPHRPRAAAGRAAAPRRPRGRPERPGRPADHDGAAARPAPPLAAGRRPGRPGRRRRRGRRLAD